MITRTGEGWEIEALQTYPINHEREPFCLRLQKITNPLEKEVDSYL